MKNSSDTVPRMSSIKRQMMILSQLVPVSEENKQQKAYHIIFGGIGMMMPIVIIGSSKLLKNLYCYVRKGNDTVRTQETTGNHLSSTLSVGKVSRSPAILCHTTKALIYVIFFIYLFKGVHWLNFWRVCGLG